MWQCNFHREEKFFDGKRIETEVGASTSLTRAKLGGEYRARAHTTPLFIYAGHFAARRNAILFLWPPLGPRRPTLLLIRMQIRIPCRFILETRLCSPRRVSARFASTLSGWKRTSPLCFIHRPIRRLHFKRIPCLNPWRAIHLLLTPKRTRSSATCTTFLNLSF